MSAVEEQIREILDRETLAWESQDVELLLSCLHEDMVWPWPPDPHAHDPLDWVMVLGRFDRERWSRSWQELFETHWLVYNRRQIRRVVVSQEGDGAFAVVDVDTLWRRREDGDDFHWQGRACKVYTKIEEGWKMIFQTGLLEYPARRLAEGDRQR